MTERTAEQAYQENLNETKELMDKIERIRGYRQGNAYADKPDWSDVGDWAYVNELLQQAVNFLTGVDD